MSVERSFEAWEEIHRQGQDLADRLAQGFYGLLRHPPPFAWPPSTPKKSPFELDFQSADGVSAILDIGSRIGQVGAEFGAGINGMVQHFFRQLPVPFRHEEGTAIKAELESRRKDDAFERRGAAGGGELGSLGVLGIQGISAVGEESGDELADEDGFDFDLRASGRFKKPTGSINITTTYDSRMRGTESSLAARGDFWRLETSNGSSTSGNENAPLFLVQLGPVLFVRDTTLLLPVHLSKQHLLWYGYDRKNGLHSLCPALWSKHRRWLLMSMICLNPLACAILMGTAGSDYDSIATQFVYWKQSDPGMSTVQLNHDSFFSGTHLESFMDLQFPSGQLTYLAGEGLTTSAFLPVCGGLLQAQGRYPGETKFSFSYKNKRGTRVTPMVQWPDKSFSLGIAHAMAWKRSGLMVRPTVQLSVCPTFGGSNPGMRAELIHSVKEGLNLIYGCSCTQHQHPSAYASLSLGRSKWNGNVGNSGAVIRVECPLSNMGRPFFSLQLNGGFEF